jgi:hypothetical protein
MTVLTTDDRRQIEELANLVEALMLGFAGLDKDDDDWDGWQAAVYDFHGRAVLKLYRTLDRCGLLDGAQWYDEIGRPGRLYAAADGLDSGHYQGRWISDSYLGLPGTGALYDNAAVELARERLKAADKGRIWQAVTQAART